MAWPPKGMRRECCNTCARWRPLPAPTPPSLPALFSNASSPCPSRAKGRSLYVFAASSSMRS
eukprot:5895302-Amphidinium_carterae.1